MSITSRLAEVEKRLDALEKKSSKPRRPLLVSAEGICGLDPERFSAICPDGSLYRRNQGCLGIACKETASKYYAKRYAAQRRTTARAQEVDTLSLRPSVVHGRFG